MAGLLPGGRSSPASPLPTTRRQTIERILFTFDRISTWVGKIFSWAILLLTAVTCYDVTARYVFSAPTLWAFDMSYILYGIFFMMAGAYTLARNGHVRGDVLYRFLPVRVQAGLDLFLYFLFFFPGIVALVYAGWDFTLISWHLREHSSLTPGGPPVYHFKTFIPIAGFFVFLQGIAETMRCIVTLRTGHWPRRLHDTEEVNVEQLKEMVERTKEKK